MNNENNNEKVPCERPQEWHDISRKFHLESPQELCDFSRKFFLKMLSPQRYEDYPESIQEIADVIGIGNALWLIHEWPVINEKDERYKSSTVKRIRIYVPTKDELKTNHRLVKILGWDNAYKMAAHPDFGGRELRPATKGIDQQLKSHRDSHIISQVYGGKSIGLVALMNNVSEKHVRKLTKNIKPIQFQEE